MRKATDETLLAVLGEVLRASPSARAYAIAESAPELSEAIDELALCDFDSLLDDDAVLLRTSVDNVRSASFTSSSWTVEFEILDDERTLVGQILPPLRSSVDVCQFDGMHAVESDEAGRFRVSLGEGPLRLTIGRASTPWITR